MTQWRVVDLTDFSGQVRSRRGGMLVGEIRVPFAEVSCVLLGPRVSLTSGLLNLAAQYDVLVVSCDWRGVPVSASCGWSSNSRVCARQRAQARASQPRIKNGWKRIVQSKIAGQANNLTKSNPEVARKLLNAAKNVRSGDIENVEAQAARTYWNCVTKEPEFSRRPGEGSGLNGMLDYGYAVLRGVVIKGTISAGLAPALGLHHRNRSNAFALADDLIEPFRPAVDWQAFEWEGESSLRNPDTKAWMVDVLKTSMGDSGQSVQSEIATFAQSVARYFEGEVRYLSVPRWSLPNG